MKDLEFKGTKGEWKQSHRMIPKDKDGMYSTQVYDSNGETICSMSWCGSPPVSKVENGVKKSFITSLAPKNAKLISAAPDLLESTILLRDAFLGLTKDSMVFLDPKEVKALNKATRAIEKALK